MGQVSYDLDLSSNPLINAKYLLALPVAPVKMPSEQGERKNMDQTFRHNDLDILVEIKDPFSAFTRIQGLSYDCAQDTVTFVWELLRTGQNEMNGIK